MNFWSRLSSVFRKERLTDLPLSFRYPESRSGYSPSAISALEVSTVNSCVRAISEGIAQVPVYCHQRDARGVLGPRIEHPIIDIYGNRPNQWQSAFEFRETILMHAALTGNAFVFVNRLGDGRVVELIPIEPGRVGVIRERDMSLSYTVTFDDRTLVKLTNEQIWHIRGPSYNTWMGLDAVKVAREAIGLAVALEGSHADMHKGGANVSGMLSVDGVLSPERFVQLSAWLDRHTAGGDRAGKPVIVDQGTTYAPMRMSGVDQQHLETRQNQVLEICRHFRVNPMMVGATQTPTYASAEQMFIAHVVHCLQPWAERIEASAAVNLFQRGERYQIRHDFNGLMRGAVRDLAEYYAKALGSGGHQPWLTQNEVRADMGYDPADGGDVFPQPTNVPAPAAAA